MYRQVADFVADFARESKGTLKLFRAIPDSAAGQAVGPGGRTLGRLAWHITCSLGEIARSSKVGEIEPHDDQAADPPRMAEIAATYEHNAERLRDLFRERWTDQELDGTIQMYGMEWKRGDVLTMIITHEAHHRGQMTVLMRQAGLAVPGIVGPAREEWAQWGMPAQR
ncbi:MAG TPA: DinB family protein [Gemmatimonadales bacterium]|nr:DinB family protein [Gemmatimonadales bacterium]